MKNSTLPVQSLIKMNQIQSRLKTNKFLNKQSVPGSLDGRIFKILQNSNYIPPRQQYPNFYHWYIFIRLFSEATIQKWIAKSISVGDDDNDLVEELKKTLQFSLEIKQDGCDSSVSKNCTNLQKLNKTDENLQKNPQPRLKKIQNNQELERQAFLKDKNKQHQYILQIKLNLSSAERIQELEKKFTQMIELCKFQVITEQNQSQIRLHFKSNLNNCQTLKDLISKWPEVKNIQFKKQKKQGGSRCQVQAKDFDK